MNGSNSLWFPAFCSFYPGPERPVFAKNWNDGQARPVSLAEARLLSMVSGCRSIEDHIAVLDAKANATVAALGYDRVQTILRSWVECGLLRPASLLGSNNAVVPTTTRLVILTSDRPQSLCRCLTAFRELEGLPKTISIIDDSRHKRHSQKNQECISKAFWRGGLNQREELMEGSQAGLLNGRTRGRIAHVTRERRGALAKRMAHELESEGIQEELLRFALLGPENLSAVPLSTAGASRNTSLLISEDESVVSVDDDVLPNWATFTESDSQTLVMSETPLYSQFYATIEGMNQDATQAASPLKTLCSVLGSLGSIDRNVHLDLSEMPPAAGLAWEKYRGQVVAATVGVWGARQFSNPLRAVLHQAEQPRVRGTKNDALYSVQRFGLSARHRTVGSVTSRVDLSTACWAFNGKAPHPPFFPWGRRQDDAFALLTSRTNPGSLMAELPVAVFHDPSSKPAFSQSEMGKYSVDTGLYNYATLRIFSRQALFASDPRERLVTIGRRYREIARIPCGDFREFLWDIQKNHLRALLKDVERQLDESLERESGRGDARLIALRNYRDSIEATFHDPDQVVPAEFRGKIADGYFSNADEIIAVIQNLYKLWADLLDAWPTIWEASRNIGSSLGLSEA